MFPGLRQCIRGGKKRVLGFGSPLTDIIAATDEAGIRAAGGCPGGSVQIPDTELDRITATVKPEVIRRSTGGSAANTALLLAALGINTALFGKLGRDENGDFYRKQFTAMGGSADAFLCSDGGATGRCLSLVTPDGERTMRCSPGVSMQLAPEEITVERFRGAALVLAEGFMYDTGMLPAVMKAAKTAGAATALDLSSYQLVSRNRAGFAALLEQGNTDLLIANRQEAAALSKGDENDKNLLEKLARHAPAALLKLGAGGAMLKTEKGIFRAAAEAVKPADSTGAGDWFAAGFFLALAEGADEQDALNTGCRFGAEAVKHYGAMPDEDALETLKRISGKYRTAGKTDFS